MQNFIKHKDRVIRPSTTLTKQQHVARSWVTRTCLFTLTVHHFIQKRVHTHNNIRFTKKQCTQTPRETVQYAYGTVPIKGYIITIKAMLFVGFWPSPDCSYTHSQYFALGGLQLDFGGNLTQNTYVWGSLKILGDALRAREGQHIHTVYILDIYTCI